MDGSAAHVADVQGAAVDGEPAGAKQRLAVATPFEPRQAPALIGELPHAVVLRVGNEDEATERGGNVRREPQLTPSVAEVAPTGTQLAFGRETLHTVVAAVGNPQHAGPVHGQSRGGAHVAGS